MKQILIALLLCVPVFAEKPSNESVSITVTSSIERIKAELVRLHLGYDLCGEQPSRLTFCAPPEKPRRGFVDQRERRFVFTPGDSVRIEAIEIIRRTNALGGKRELSGMDKQTRAVLQKLLERLKAAHSSPSS